MIVRAVSDETLITSQKYVLMIATAAIFTYLSHVYRSIRMFSLMYAKEINENAFHAYVRRTFNGRLQFGRIGSTLGLNGRYIIQ